MDWLEPVQIQAHQQIQLSVFTPAIEVRRDVFILIILVVKPKDILWLDLVSSNLLLTQSDSTTQSSDLFAINDRSGARLKEVEWRQNLFFGITVQQSNRKFTYIEFVYLIVYLYIYLLVC